MRNNSCLFLLTGYLINQVMKTVVGGGMLFCTHHPFSTVIGGLIKKSFSHPEFSIYPVRR